ncbi:MAG: GNAT family N-acetyltransferase [Rhodocyclaceae bacterium]|jgi:predicted GNAT family N-acyltransferase|nr:GNAT family N-acetyltransferase [Rhodocyclaceae bacterium]MCA3023534.1 GNAT family N-acetyltransferase [Rhodocyclaceae bacterium]MCA3028484.1 GNAT family N-acetyltransferase [Rhodocyclaceae bacterium]MCA3053698.1 GNAT family N-acetyltransferase [Rhodocyclaceae bacterium]MCA3081780.1 GNAT family N-acetyltransferase [Rhodocyclaceae bacterium]
MNASAFEVKLASWALCGDELSKIRHAVFVQEQGVPLGIELDEKDTDPLAVTHAAATSAIGGMIGTARMLLEPAAVRIGRMAVLPGWRGRGVGQKMLEVLCDEAKRRGYYMVRLYAQTHAAPFYAKQGFIVFGEEFFEAGIRHIEMRRSP